MDLMIDVKKEKGYTLISVNGEIDLYNAKELKDRVGYVCDDSPDGGDLIIDFKDVDYIDSTGLGIMIGIKRRIAESNGGLVLVLHSDRINKLFDITGLKNIFTITRSVDDAVAALKKG